MSYLTDYKDIDGGFVAFRGNPKGGKITGKGTIRTVVKYDNSMFTWGFFLPTKDKTTGILKSFITKIENLVDQKVKVIRCGNGTEFKKREMNQFCKMKDHLEKFDGKADKGFFVGYSMNSKASRVFNSRKRIVEENLHIRFSESTPNVVGTKACDSADPKSSHDDGFKPLSDDDKKVDEDPSKGSECKDQEQEDNVYSTKIVNGASTNGVNTVSKNISSELPFDSKMIALENIIILVPTTRGHKDHPLDQVIGDLQSATQTRNMIKNLEEHGFVSTIQ
uniref:Retrotransposon protein, putative, Ty1-copia subclass n=1 Tax=Tanacetum cinerariifolium TaxID=118510 RepID=A0A6L2KHB2_TANCI|nr:retrotransposon protein, putative, Ty1-copia subclass [Tanacetum cinerariifolium]